MLLSENTTVPRAGDRARAIDTPGGIGQGFALTPAQLGMFADSQVAASRGLNVEQVVCEIDDALDAQMLRDAWEGVTAEFDALRLRFEFRDSGNPTQRVACSAVPPFRCIDWSVRDAASVRQALQEYLDQDRQQGFDLSESPLFRVTMFRLPGAKTVILWTVHHVIIDGASYPMVFDRVLSEVRRMRTGTGVARSPARIPYAAFLTWLEHQDSHSGIEYYRQVLQGFSEPTPLPFAGPPGKASPGQPAGNIERRISDQLTSQLLEMATYAGASLNTVVQLAWGLLLGRYTGRDDVVFGATWSGRQIEFDGSEHVVGPFINTLPVRVDVSGSPDGRAALQALRAQHIASRPYHQTPPGQIKEASELARASTMFRTLVVFERQRPLAVLERGGSGNGACKFWTRSQTGYPLALAAHVEGDALVFELEFDLTLFDAVQANEILDSLVHLLGAMPGALDQGVDLLPVIDPDRLRSMTVGEAGREVVPERPRVIEQILDRGLGSPDAPAICDLEGGELNFGQLRDHLLGVAAGLRDIGVRNGDVVAILIPRSIDAIVAQLAVHCAGGAFLMLDPEFPESRLRYCLEDSGARWLIVNSDTCNAVVDPVARRVDIRELDLPAQAGMAGVGSSPRTAAVASEALSYLIYTSGSTGEPKGVRISEASLANHIAASIELYELRESDRVLQFAAQSFDASIEEIFSTLAAGSTLVLRNDKMASSPRDFFATVGAQRISVLDLPTAFWHQIVHLSDIRPWPDCVRLLIVGGERASPAVLQKFRASGNGHIRWLNSYGPTETTIGSTVYDDSSGDHDADCLPIGRSMPGHSHYLLDDRLRPVPTGVTGQLYIGGAGVALGYHDRGTLTAERFVPHPWRRGAKLYATGDLVRRTPRGNLVFVDRADNQVKVRGFRVELGEIEVKLSQHPLVREAVVIVHEHGEDASTLVGFVESQHAVTPLAIREYLASMLPHYMVPGHIVVDAQLPRTNAGKIDRQALRARGLDQEAQEAAPAPDADSIEWALLKIWSGLLGIPIHDTLADFFEMGGNSLTVMTLFARIERHFGKTLNPVEFLRTPTLKHLAEMIRGESATTNPCLLRMNAGRPDVRPLFLTPGLMGSGTDYVHLVNSLDPSTAAYAFQVRGLRAGEAPHRDLEEAARDYVSCMQEVQPEGPYALAGYSAGCIVAVIIVRLLLARGERVDFVGMIDGIPPPTVKYPSAFTDLRRLESFVRTAAGRVLEILRQANPVRIFWQRGYVAGRRILGHWILGTTDKDATLDQIFVGQKIAFESSHKRVLQAHLSMLMQSDPTPVPIDVVLFRTSLNPLTGPYEDDLGWSRLIRGRIDVEMMPGEHEDLLAARGAPALGERMNRYLAKRAR